MEQRESMGCFKRILMGCGCVFVGVIGLGIFMTMMVVVNKPADSEVVSLEASDSIDPAILENPLVLSNGPVDPQLVKPVRLKLSAEMARVTVRPGEPNSKISIEGDYDKANFELITKAEDHSDYVDYEITLDSKRSFWGHLFNDGGFNDNDIQNEIVITLPPNMLLEIETDFAVGDFEMDLTGLAISKLNLTGSTGQFRIKMEERNQVRMESFRADFSMGELRVSDFQNLRFSNARTEMSMGSMRFLNSGPLEEDLEINSDGSFGEVNWEIPKNAKVTSSGTAFAGEFRGVRDTADLPEDAPKVTFKGEMAFGEMTVRQRTQGEDITALVLKWIRADGIEVAVENYKALLANEPTKYNFSAHAINNLGYRLLRSDSKKDLAIQVFIFNTLAHPYYANGFDSLGEGYLETGQLELALKNYRIAYDMDPSNHGARRIVEELVEKLEAQSNSPEE